MHYVFEQGVNTTKTRCMYMKTHIFSQTLDVVSSYRILGTPSPPKLTCSRHLPTRLPGQSHPQFDEIHGSLRGQL